MTFPRSIAVSLLLHTAVLGYAFLQFGPTDELRAEPSLSGVVVDYSHVEFAERNDETERRSDQEDAPRSELVSMDLEAGLDGDPETNPDEPEEPEPKRDRPSPETSESEPSVEKPPSEETDEPKASPEPSNDALAASEESEADREVPDRAPEPAETSDPEAEEEKADQQAPEEENAASGEQRVAEREGTGGGESEQGAGSGSGSGATGRGGGDGASGRPGVDRGKLIRQYTLELHRRLAEKKFYPHAARRAGIEGTVQVEVTIDSEGNILSVDLHESSGHGILDRAAMEIMRSLEKFPAPPEALAWSKKRLRVPIPYQLDTRG